MNPKYRAWIVERSASRHVAQLERYDPAEALRPFDYLELEDGPIDAEVALSEKWVKIKKRRGAEAAKERKRARKYYRQHRREILRKRKTTAYKRKRARTERKKHGKTKKGYRFVASVDLGALQSLAEGLDSGKTVLERIRELYEELSGKLSEVARKLRGDERLAATGAANEALDIARELRGVDALPDRKLYDELIDGAESLAEELSVYRELAE